MSIACFFVGTSYKTHVNIRICSNYLLKTNMSGNRKEIPKPSKMYQKCSKPTHVGATTAQNLAGNDEKSLRIPAPALRRHSLTCAVLPRLHARTNRNLKSSSTSPLRGVGQAGLAPPNLRYEYIYIYICEIYIYIYMYI